MALKEFLQGSGHGTPYAELATQLGVSENVVKVTVHRFSKRYRELLNDEIANTVSSREEIEEERRHLFDVMGRLSACRSNAISRRLFFHSFGNLSPPLQK